jgi:putative Holliday junction resolvase
MIICYRLSMRLLGIDYGTKRVGIALSDEDAQFALPFSVIANSQSLMSGLVSEIDKIAIANEVKEIVMGESKDYKGEPNKIMSGSLDLKKQLEGKGFIVHLQPEFMTSVQAERFQGKNAKSDSSAAALILQAYLDKEKSSQK